MEQSILMNNKYERKLIASSELFWGYTQIYDIRYYESFEEIITHFHNELLSLLKNNNLVVLYEKCKKCKFHCHTHTFEGILITDTDIYLCDHC